MDNSEGLKALSDFCHADCKCKKCNKVFKSCYSGSVLSTLELDVVTNPPQTDQLDYYCGKNEVCPSCVDIKVASEWLNNEMQKQLEWKRKVKESRESFAEYLKNKPRKHKKGYRGPLESEDETMRWNID